MNLRKIKTVAFENNIDVSDYCIDKFKGNTKYELFGVINHTGMFWWSLLFTCKEEG